MPGFIVFIPQIQTIIFSEFLRLSLLQRILLFDVGTVIKYFDYYYYNYSKVGRECKKIGMSLIHILN